MRFALLLLAATPAYADTFGGFSGVDRPYLVNQDRVCTPLVISGATATGNPKCSKVTDDVIAHLSVKPPAVQSGAKAAFSASASGRTLTVSRKGEAILTWDAPDPIGKIVEVYASQYEDRVAVAFTTRRAGRESTDIVAFDLGQAQQRVDNPVPVVTPPPPTPAVVDDPAVTKAVDAARKAPRPKQAQAWQGVLAIAPTHSEAHYQLAALHAAKHENAEAVKELEAMAAADAVEFQVEARFDAAFAALRADPKFRQVAGLDRKPATTYERMMGFGGKWEQTGTSCDKPEVSVIATRARSIAIRVKSACEGSRFDIGFKGTWRVDGDTVVVTIPTRGKAVEAKDEAPCKFEPVGDEDTLRCAIGRDLEFQVLPTRR